VASKNIEISIEYEMKGDVYSFALILWEMLTRKIPWEHCKLSFSFSISFSLFLFSSFVSYFFFSLFKFLFKLI